MCRGYTSLQVAEWLACDPRDLGSERGRAGRWGGARAQRLGDFSGEEGPRAGAGWRPSCQPSLCLGRRHEDLETPAP